MSGTPSPIFRNPGLSIERQRNKEGPSPVWIIWQPHKARIVMGDDFKAILKIAKWPPKTPTGEALRDWLASWGYERPGKAPAEPQEKTKTVI